MINGKKTASRIEQIIEEMQVNKTRIAEVLGASKTSSNQSKYYVLETFLKNLKNGIIDTKRISALAQFFRIPDNQLLSIDASVSVGGDQIGIHDNPVTATGQNNVVSHVTGKGNKVSTNIGQDEEIQQFLALPPKERKVLLEFIKSKK